MPRNAIAEARLGGHRLKAVLGVDMLLGRLEIFAWLTLLTPGTWIGRRLEE